MPGEQKPHCDAWKPARRSATGAWPAALRGRPAAVVMAAPATENTGARHELMDVVTGVPAIGR
jgi:hypothetical protein